MQIRAGGGESAKAHDEFDAPVPFHFFALADKKQAGLTGAGKMSAAAGLAVKAVDFDDAKWAFAVHCFANALGGEFGGERKTN